MKEKTDHRVLPLPPVQVLKASRWPGAVDAWGTGDSEEAEV